MKEPLKITPAQDHRYRELAAQGVPLMAAVRQVQQEFNLPEPHSRQAVSQRKYGFPPGKRGAPALQAPAELEADAVLGMMAEAIEARQGLPALQLELAACHKEIARLKAELAAKEKQTQGLASFQERLRGARRPAEEPPKLL